MPNPPASVTSDGHLRVQMVTTIADRTAPLDTELNAVGAKDFSLYITGEGWQPSTDEAVVTDERLASIATYEQRGRVQDHLTVQYVFNIATPAADVMRLALAAGTATNLVTRHGVAFATAFAEDDLVDIYPVIAGVPVKDKPTMNGVQTITQRMFIPAPGVLRDVAVVSA